MDKVGEIVTIFIGQSGVQVANACWELLCLEHGVGPDGCVDRCYGDLDLSYCTFFSEKMDESLSPRALLVDLEPTVIDEIKTGAYRQLFSPASLVSGKEDAANNFARGYYNVGQEAIETAMHRVCQLCEACYRLNGFIVFRAIGGGTGSGFGTLMLEHLTRDFPKKTKLDFSIYPAPNIATAIVEPYNAVLATHGSLDYEDCCFLIDNEALYDICARNLNVGDPTYTNLNRIEAQVVSCMTASMRFDGPLHLGMEELRTNLVPYPRIHFPLLTYAPLVSPATAMYSDITTQQITYDCFHPSNQMVKCDPRAGAYMSCCLLYRGDVTPTDINKTIMSLKGKKSIQFVRWSPSGFKVGINYQPTMTVPGGDIAKTARSVAMASNNTAIKYAWTKVGRKFDLMYQKRAFVHHYVGEGMDESVFQDSREDMATLIEDYKEIEK